MTGPDPAERLTALLNGGDSPTDPNRPAPVSPEGHKPVFSTDEPAAPVTGTLDVDHTPSSSFSAPFTTVSAAVPTTPTPRPRKRAEVMAASGTIFGAGDLVTTPEIAGVLAVQRAVLRDRTVIARPLADLDHYIRLPVDALTPLWSLPVIEQAAGISS